MPKTTSTSAGCPAPSARLSADRDCGLVAVVIAAFRRGWGGSLPGGARWQGRGRQAMRRGRPLVAVVIAAFRGGGGGSLPGGARWRGRGRRAMGRACLWAVVPATLAGSWLLQPGSSLRRRYTLRGAHEGADDPEQREDDAEAEQGVVALAQRRHAEHDEQREIQDAEQNPEESRHMSSLRLGVVHSDPAPGAGQGGRHA